MLGIIFSLDYEIYGNGTGDFEQLMVEPTARLMDVFNKNGVKLTIMPDVGSILALKRVGAHSKVITRIEKQLQTAIATGHDVQLHLHPAWFNAVYEQQEWILDFNEYALVGLAPEKIHSYIKQGKEYLEQLLQDVDPGYRCIAYRAGNWLMQPSRNVLVALAEQNFLIESSVYKGGNGMVGDYEIDYRDAQSDILPWPVDPDDINKQNHSSAITEVPILCRPAFIGSMLTPKRIRMQLNLRYASQAYAPKTEDNGAGSAKIGTGKSVTGLQLIYPKKFDFCRLGFREMKSFLRYAESVASEREGITPMVAIGHSTEFKEKRDVEKFVGYVNDKYQQRVNWTTFSELAAHLPTPIPAASDVRDIPTSASAT